MNTVNVLTQTEMARLIESAKVNRLREAEMLVQLIAQTGVRAFEVRYFTVEALRQGYADIIHDRKIRRVFLPGELTGKLRELALGRGIAAGAIFTDTCGHPISRQSVRQRLKRLADKAGFPAERVSATALRSYYAGSYLSKNTDIPALSEHLGYRGISERFAYPVTNEQERIAHLNALYD
jgi:integrase